MNASHIITKENSGKPVIRNLTSRAYLVIAKKAPIHCAGFLYTAQEDRSGLLLV